MSLTVTVPEENDLAWILDLNNNAVPHVNALGLQVLREMQGQSTLFAVARVQGDAAGFLVAFGPGADYSSPNFLWFKANLPSFLYIDRAVVHPDFRRRGVGTALYGEAIRLAGLRAVPLTCEVNVRPPNEASMRFHLGLGFREVGRQDTEGGKKTVSLLSR